MLAEPLRLVVGLGNPERERCLLMPLLAGGEFALIARCLGAEQLLDVVRTEVADALLVAFDLHQLTSTTLAELAQQKTPLVVLVPLGEEAQYAGVATVPLDADAAVVRQVLLEVVMARRRGAPWDVSRSRQPTPEDAAPRAGSSPERIARATPSRPLDPGTVSGDAAERERLSTSEPADREEPAGQGVVLAVTSGLGSPGRTTVALGLAVTLGAVARTVLVEADLAGPSLAAYLDLDPTRNVALLAHAEPASSHEWTQALAEELQPLDVRSPNGWVLAGVPKPEMRSLVSERFFEELVTRLRRRYDFVILDAGVDHLSSESSLHRRAVALADHVLLVAAADLVGLYRARGTLQHLSFRLGVPRERVALVVNRHDWRYHQGRTELGWALGVGIAAVIPFDQRGVQRALSRQRPLVLDRRSAAGRALRELADRVYGGRIRLPPEPARPRRLVWLPMPLPTRLPWRGRRAAAARPSAESGLAAWTWLRNLPGRLVRSGSRVASTDGSQ
jgi:Flp pilus assembly CpaE family ATPase